jgi:hypothetical protein
MYEETKERYLQFLESQIKGLSFERNLRYKNAIEDFEDTKKAKEVGVYKLSADGRRIVTELIKSINNIKDPEGKEINFIIKINDLLKRRRAFLLSEIGDDEGEPIDQTMIDSSALVIKLANIYMELYRAWIHMLDEGNKLSMVKVVKQELPPELVRRKERFSREYTFRKEFILAN